MIAALVAFGVVLAGGLTLTGVAAATNESATIGLKMSPLQGPLYKEAPRPVNWQVQSTISTPDPTIQPLKRSDLTLPDGSLSFNPDPDMPVCPDSAVNESSVSVEVPDIIAACPDSIIGNGLATFALAQRTSLGRDGVMIVFNGGFQKSGPLKGRPRIKVYAYSYDTQVGVYTEAALSKQGDLNFFIPQLTADSSVTSLSLNIPGEPIDIFIASKNETVTLPAGQDPDYAQATCSSGSWAYGADFELGDRDTIGNPTSPTTFLSEFAVEPCVGLAGKAKFAGPKAKGAKKTKRGKKTRYKVKVKNVGTATVKNAKVLASGKGVKGKKKASIGNLSPGQSKTVKLKLKFTKQGKIKTKFKADAKKTKTRTSVKRIEVR